MKIRSAYSVLVVAMLLMSLLTGCATASRAPAESSQIYQPRVLELKAGQPVQTKVGSYTPQVDETWHSAAAYEALEAQLLNAAAVLAQERNR